MSCTLKGIDTFLFDLDATLYPKENGVLDELWRLFHLHIAQHTNIDADDISAFLKELPANGVLFLEENHGYNREHASHMFADLDLNMLEPCGFTEKGLAELKGRKVIFTNATKSHTEAVLKKLELNHHFDYLSYVENRDYFIKPHAPIYEELLQVLSVQPKQCCMIEDTAENLKPAHDLGMKTVLIANMDKADLPYVDYAYPSLLDWLAAVQQ